MDRRDAIASMLSACAVVLRQSQAKTLIGLVDAALRCQRISLAALGRQMDSVTSVKHRIKRVWRCIVNPRVEPTLAMVGLDRPERLDRLILVLALAYLILLGVGLIAQRRHRPGAWSSNNRTDAASLFQIGQWMLPTLGLRGPIPAIQRQFASEVPKWG